MNRTEQPACTGGWPLPAPAERGWPRRQRPGARKPCTAARRALARGEARE